MSLSITDLFLPTLSTPRLSLHFFTRTPEQYTHLLAVMNTPTAHSKMGNYGIDTPEKFDQVCAVARLHDNRLSGGVANTDVYYIIHLEGKVIGGVSMQQRVAQSDGKEIILPPDIGWCMYEEYMGQGYATEAAKELLRFAREEAGFRDVIVFRAEGNEASNRVAEKLGFVDGGACPDLDHPGTMLSIYILPGMERFDENLKGGLGFGLDHA